MEAQRQFSINVEDRIKDRIANAPLPIPKYYKGLIEESDEIQAKRQLKMSKAAQLAGDIESSTSQLYQAEKEERKSGVEYISESTSIDATGGRTVARKKTGTVEKLKAELKDKKDERKALMETKSKTDWLSIANDALGSKTVNLIPFGEPLDWTPPDGEQFGEGYVREFGALNILRDRVKTTWDAPRTVSEAIQSADAEIDALASEPPGFGGHIRGSSVSDRGGLQIGNPTKRIGFVEKRISNETVTTDVAKTLAFFFRDHLKKVSREHIKATYSDEGAISSADKAVLIPKLEAELWQQRRVVEAAYRACRAAGIRNLNRPKDTPVEILLDVVPFSKARLMRVEAVRSVPNPDAGIVPTEAADEMDFEGDE